METQSPSMLRWQTDARVATFASTASKTAATGAAGASLKWDGLNFFQDILPYPNDPLKSMQDRLGVHFFEEYHRVVVVPTIEWSDCLFL